VGRRPGLLFGCHLDVVGPGEAAWTHPPFGAVEANGKIYGRGAVDMKGGMAAAAAAINRVVASGRQLQGDIVFAAVAGEETDSSGAERFIAHRDELELAPNGLAGVIVPEPTGLGVVTAHRGLLWLEVTTTGKAAHSSTPHLGVNAIESMRLILNELENYDVSPETHELLGRCTMSINTISGGKALNVVPDKCTLGIDIRTLPGQDHRRILADLEALLARLKAKNGDFNAGASALRCLDPLETDSCCDFVRDFCAAVGADRTRPIGYTTDGPYFASLGAPVVIFGPGEPGLCHKPDEHIEIDELQKAAELYENIILKFLT
jgi:succinyl-diaminopimelate desuccinylase